ncbi:unnamed protein product, partial [Polarella glacialis]
SGTAVVGSVALPTLASVLFVYASVAESSGTKSKGLARYNSAQALELAAEQEKTLADAESAKAFLPFGVGLTAIFAAACVTLRIFDEAEGEASSLLLSPFFSTLMRRFFGLSSVIGAMITADKALLMGTKLTPRSRPEENQNITEWEAAALSLDSELNEPQLETRIAVALSTVLASLIPVPLFFHSLEEVTAGLDTLAVIVSSTAAAQAAVVFLASEREFVDAERRIAVQSKQAALSELFYAQAQAESAVLAPSTTMSGAALAAASVAVEFSQLGG